jgi:hypothetical protein
VASGTVDGGRRRPPRSPASGKGALGSRAPRASGSWAWESAGSVEAPGLSLLLSPGDPGPVAATAAASPAAPGKVGREPPGRAGGCLGAARTGVGGAPDARHGTRSGARAARGVAHPRSGQGPERRRGQEQGWGRRWEVSLVFLSSRSTPTFPLASSSVPVVTDREDACALWGSREGFSG